MGSPFLTLACDGASMMRAILTLSLLLIAPTVAAEADLDVGADAETRSYCVIGDVVNTGGGPCEGIYCEGWSRGGWHVCWDIHP